MCRGWRRLKRKGLPRGPPSVWPEVRIGMLLEPLVRAFAHFLLLGLSVAVIQFWVAAPCA